MREERLNEVWGIFFLALGVLISISLFSYNETDLAFFSSSPVRPPENYVGIIGAYIAGLLFLGLGSAAYILPLLIFIWGFRRFSSSGGEFHKLYARLVGAGILFLSSSALLSILKGPAQKEAFKGGGIIGYGLGRMLTAYTGDVGSPIILTFLVILSFLLATEFSLKPLLSGIGSRSLGLFAGLLQKRRSDVKIASAGAGVRGVRGKPKRESLSLVLPIEGRGTAKSLSLRERIVLEEPPKIKKPQIEPASKIAKKPQSEPISLKKTEEKAPPKAEVPNLTTKEGYRLPGLDLLDSPPPIEERRIKDDLRENSQILEGTLADFGIEVRVVQVSRGPAVTRYELQPAPGVKIQRIASLSDDIALAMKAQAVRVVAPIPGKAAVGVEVPNTQTALVYLKEILASEKFQSEGSKLTLALGKDITGVPLIANLGEMPHLLIAGATGSGKTVCVNGLIASMLFRATPHEVKFLMVDPKMVELAIFNDLPHLVCPVVTDAKKASVALNWVVGEMERRYQLLAKEGARNINIYNAKARPPDSEYLPYIVVIIDELADLMVVAAGEIENAITRLAQLSRAVGIHMVLATQRPSVDVITGVIKANFPARISFKVASKVDSRTVLDMNGADKLLGRGDMLFIRPGTSKPIRSQGTLVSDKEIEQIVEFIKSQLGPSYKEEIIAAQEEKEKRKGYGHRDELFDEAVEMVKEAGTASVSMLQRRLRLSYQRAARIIDMLEEDGTIGPYQGSKPREVLIDREEEKEEE